MTRGLLFDWLRVPAAGDAAAGKPVAVKRRRMHWPAIVIGAAGVITGVHHLFAQQITESRAKLVVDRYSRPVPVFVGGMTVEGSDPPVQVWGFDACDAPDAPAVTNGATCLALSPEREWVPVLLISGARTALERWRIGRDAPETAATWQGFALTRVDGTLIRLRELSPAAAPSVTPPDTASSQPAVPPIPLAGQRARVPAIAPTSTAAEQARVKTPTPD